MRKLLTVFSLLVGLSLAGLSLAQQDNPDATLLQGLAGNEDFSTLVGLIDQAGLIADLEGAGPFTIFAPTNGVFEELEPTILEQLSNDPDLLKSVLMSHVVQGAYGVEDLGDAEEGSVMTLNGEPLEIDLGAGGLKVNGADLNSTDVGNTYSNGILHEVGDLVLSPALRSQLGIGETEEATDDVNVAEADGMAFTDLDADADGVLTQDELDTGLYTRYDANADGIIDQAEYDTNPGLFGGAFADFDADTSGDLNEEEYRGAFANNGLFTQLDADGSGDISQEEFDTNRDLLGLGATPAIGTEVETTETDTEVATETDNTPGAVVFTELDADADGLLTQEETGDVFAADPNLFSQFDADGSGDISQEEFDANRDLLGLDATGVETSETVDEAEPSLLQGLTENEDFSSLVGLIDQAGLTSDLEGAGPFTIFAPANGVFEELNRDVLEQLNNDPELLKAVLQSHVVQGAYGVKDLRDAEEGSVMTLQGEPLEINLGAGGLKINGADLNSTDVDNTYSNGVLHEVGDLVLPASILNQLGLGETDEATDDTTTATSANFVDLDTNADGVLTQDELDGGIYTRYDANADGIIDQAEYDTNPGLFGGAFADYDADASGDLNQDEYRGAYDNAGVFDSLDADRSGDISQEEYDNNRDLLGLGAAGAAVPGAVTTDAAMTDTGVFGGFDADADGLLTRDEYDTGLYSRYDANQDGVIDQAEYDTDPGLFGGAFADFDADASGDLNEEEARGAFENNTVFDSLDSDGSGDINQEEYDTNPDLLGMGAVGTAGAAVTGATATVVGAETGGAVNSQTDGTVVELLTNDGRFGTLLMAINDAGLASSLEEQAPFTLFAPTDDAFAALPDAERESILGDTDMLSNLLLYHVVPGKVMAADLVGTEPGNASANAGEVRDGQATTLEGSDLALAIEDDGSVSVNNGQASVIEADLETSDGVVHVVDGVLIPESMMNQ